MSEVRLLLGGCLEVMKTLPDASVSAVVTDPPYGQSNEKYDKGVDPRVWEECFRVCTPNAALISFAGSPTYHRIASGIEAAGWKVRQMWAWIYRDGMISSAYPKEGFDRLAPAMDPICYATKGKVLLRLEREGNAAWRVAKRRCNLSARSDSDTAATEGVGRWPRTIIADDVDGFEYFAYRRAKAEPDATSHPNQKPLALMSWLVGKLPPGSVVLDPYAGSGTTLKACQRAGLDCIGIERELAYLDIARKRLADIEADAPLFAGGAS